MGHWHYGRTFSKYISNNCPKRSYPWKSHLTAKNGGVGGIPILCQQGVPNGMASERAGILKMKKGALPCVHLDCRFPNGMMSSNRAAAQGFKRKNKKIKGRLEASGPIIQWHTYALKKRSASVSGCREERIIELAQATAYLKAKSALRLKAEGFHTFNQWQKGNLFSHFLCPK